MRLDALIEAILFCSSEPVSVSKLSQALEVPPEQIEEAVSALDEHMPAEASSSRRLQEGLGLQPGLRRGDNLTGIYPENPCCLVQGRPGDLGGSGLLPACYQKGYPVYKGREP